MSLPGSLGGRAFRGAGGIAAVCYALLPVLWIISLSLKPGPELGDGRLIPRSPGLEHYRAVFSDPQFPAALLNSVGIALITAMLAVALAVFAAYAIVRIEFSGKKIVLYCALAVAMFPPVLAVGPLFDLWRAIGLFDTWAGLILPYVSLTLPLAIWTLTAFFREIPWELERAARVDGATPMQAFRHALLPLMAPGVFASGILVFIFAWNDFLFAAALTSTDSARTVPVAIAFFTGSSQFELPTGSIAAASVVVTIPVAILVLLFQRRIIAGLTAGAVKG
ncbi:MAG: carbohydrate ABC transporter permease [Gammaproteobacteria bacterium]